MGYTVNYDHGIKIIEQSRKKMNGRWSCVLLVLMIAGSVLLFSLNDARFDWKQLLPGDADITKAALTSFMRNLSEGADFKDSITAFCSEIIDGAQIN